jgi:hypothetical protein
MYAVKPGFVRTPITIVVKAKTDVKRPPIKLITSIMTPETSEPFSVTKVDLSVVSNSILKVTRGSFSFVLS